MKLKLALPFAFFLGWAIPAFAAGPIAQPGSGYGANGSYGQGSFSFANPAMPSMKVYVYYPTGAGAPRPAPVVFFSHAFATTNPAHYAELLDHLTSRGYAVVYPTYPTLGASHDERYAILWRGFKEAALRYPDYLDLGRCGFVGHSYGGGATPRMALNGFVDEGWGGSGRFMMTMAPWYSFELSDSDLALLPPSVKFLSVVYAEDSTNDMRMACDIYLHAASIPVSERDFMILHSDTIGSYSFEANHQVPFGARQRKGEVDALDYYGTWQKLDALIDYAVTGDPSAKAIALGGGGEGQTYMGGLPGGGRELSRATVTDSPEPFRPESFYQFRWSSSDNPRR